MEYLRNCHRQVFRLCRADIIPNRMMCVGCDVCKTIHWTTGNAPWSILKQVQYYAACTGTCNWDFFLFQNYLAAKTMNQFIIKRAWSIILCSIISLHDLLWFFPKISINESAYKKSSKMIINNSNYRFIIIIN